MDVRIHVQGDSLRVGDRVSDKYVVAVHIRDSKAHVLLATEEQYERCKWLPPLPQVYVYVSDAWIEHVYGTPC